MARYPSAEWAPVAWMNRLTHHRKTQLTVHITAGEGDPRTIATWTSGKAGANFVIFRDGRCVQLSDSACKSAADRGATHTISVECVGLNGPLTNAQVQALIRLARDANRLDGVPLRLAATSSDAGIGWHRLGVDGNFPKGRMAGRLQRSPLGVKTSSAFGKLCPTDSVINQIHDVILPALAGGEGEDDMPLTDKDLEKIGDEIWGRPVTGLDGKKYTVGATIQNLARNMQYAAQDAAISRRLAEAAAKGVHLTDAQIAQIAKETAAQVDAAQVADVVDEIGSRLTSKEK